MSPAATTTSGFVAVDVNENTKKKWAAAPKDYVVPKMLDLTIENITGNVISVNSCVKDNPRLQYIITKLIQVSHNFVRDVQLQFDEWEQAWQYLTRVCLFLNSKIFVTNATPRLGRYPLMFAMRWCCFQTFWESRHL